MIRFVSQLDYIFFSVYFIYIKKYECKCEFVYFSFAITHSVYCKKERKESVREMETHTRAHTRVFLSISIFFFKIGKPHSTNCDPLGIDWYRGSSFLTLPDSDDCLRETIWFYFKCLLSVFVVVHESIDAYRVCLCVCV